MKDACKLPNDGIIDGCQEELLKEYEKKGKKLTSDGIELPEIQTIQRPDNSHNHGIQ